ncbi:MAG: NAD(+)/NADH kinase [Thermoplasmata archaeon]|nr:NAD(+)/NADH kinase [Thermoplasmata archaeon]
MRIAINANPNKPLALELARRAITKFGDRAELVLSSETSKSLGLALPHAPVEALSADVLIALGGDGTFLSTLQRSSIPLFPVNTGTVGFLAEVDGDQLDAFDAALERLLSGRYFVEERMKIASQVGGVNLPDATNEVVIHTSQVAKMRQFEIGVDGRPVGRLRADGVIVATPTGSTSYSLAAMGPVVDPALELIVVTALAPFQASHRAVLLDPARTVSVRLLAPGKEGVVVVDGQHESKLPGSEALVAYRSPRRASFLRFGSGFFQRLQGKRILPWGEDVPESEGRGRANLSTPP